MEWTRTSFFVKQCIIKQEIKDSALLSRQPQKVITCVMNRRLDRYTLVSTYWPFFFFYSLFLALYTSALVAAAVFFFPL